MPVILRVRGYRFFFFSLESREPPHIHVAHAGRYAKFWLEPMTLADVRGFRSHELTEIRQIVVKNRRLFFWSPVHRVLTGVARRLIALR